MRILLSTGLVLLTTAWLMALDDGKRVVFVVQAADRAAPRGPLRELKQDGSVLLGAGKEGSRVAGADVVSIRRLGVPLPAPPMGEHLVLSNGDRLPITALRLVGEKLVCRCPDLDAANDVELPLSSLAVWWRAAPDAVEIPDQFLRRLMSRERKRDAVYLRNGDVLEGVLESFDDKKVSLEVEKKLVMSDLDQVAAVAPGTEASDGLRPKGQHARLTLDSGARLTLATATCADGDVLQGTTPYGPRLRVPLARVVALDTFGGRAVYLSDLKPARGDEPVPFLGEDSVRWPLVNDASVDERDLRLGGGTYAKGLGMHGPARVHYKLDGKYRRFETLVGLDEKTGRRGSVRVRVLGDGKPLDIGFREELTAKSGAVPLKADVTGVKELTLEVDVGRGGNVQDHVDWADARVIR